MISRTELAGLLCGLAATAWCVCALFVVMGAWSA